MKTVNLDYTDAADQLINGKIDAFFCTAGIQTTVIEELAKECDIRLLDIDEKCRNKLLSAYPSYSESVSYTHLFPIWVNFSLKRRFFSAIFSNKFRSRTSFQPSVSPSAFNIF